MASLHHPAPSLSAIQRQLLNDYQDGFPLVERPFADIAQRLGVTETDILNQLRELQERGMISRVGPVFRPNRVGTSTLAALAVPPARFEEVAAMVSGYPEVNHNYEREHRFNLWFVATAPNRERLDEVLADIGQRAGLPVLNLPMIEDYFINLGFPLQWN